MGKTITVNNDNRSGADELRLLVSNMDDCDETFLDRYTAEQLVQIFRAHLASDWDLYPDEWEERQVREALAGKVPQWDADERPVYGAEDPRP